MRKQTLLLLLVLASALSYAQERAVTGLVTSVDENEPIPYAAVKEVGTNNAVITDMDGHYSIRITTENSVLEFSFVGMKSKRVDVGANASIDVSLETETFGVDEVVVTALGISREKKSLGYSSQAIKSEDILEANPSNAISSLSGRVAGLQISGQNFGGSQNILLRGASSFSGNNQPLFVVDGIPLSNESFNTEETQKGSGGYDYGSLIADLNPHDIASIDVLKGSAASALYGSRGQNGVIMISTKSGKSGKRSFSIDVNSGITIERVTTMPKLQNTYGGGYSTTFPQATIDGVTYDVVEYKADESWGPKFDESLRPIHWWGMSDYEQGIITTPQTSPWVASENDVETFFETGVSYQNSVSISSSGENQSLRFSYANVNSTGVNPNSEQKKNTFSLSGETTIMDGLIELNGSATYVDTDTKGRPFRGSGDSPNQMLFQWGQRQLDMEQLKHYENADGSQRAWNRTSATDDSPIFSDNPYWSAYRNYQHDDRSRFYGKVGGTVHFTKELSAQGNLYLDTYTFNTRERVDIGSQETSSYQEATYQGTETNLEGKILYRKRLNDFDLSGMIGGNLRRNNNSSMMGRTNGGLLIASMWNLSNSVSQAITTGYTSKKKVNSSFGMASVGWKEMIYTDVTYRMDFDSSLPSHNNQYDYFSASGSFIASEIIDADWLDRLKLRVNYGETGNGTSAYQVGNTSKLGTPFNGNPMFENNTQLNNENIKPEQTREVELGIEAAFLNNRIGTDISWYNRKTYDQIVPIEVPGSTGYKYRVINAGKIRNRGIEVFLYGTPIKKKDWQWDITFNLAKNKNLVLDLPNGLDRIEIGSVEYGGAVLAATEGATFQELYGYDYVYDENGNKLINPDTGFYEQGEFKSLGSVLPDYTAGLHNKIRYKNFDLGILIDTSQGGTYYSLAYVFGMYSGLQEETAAPTSHGNTIREDGIVVPGMVATRDASGNITATAPNEKRISGKQYSQNHFHVFGTPSATGFFDASYIKLREVSIGYQLPKLTEWIQSAHISIFGRNLAVWGLDNEGIDPETIVAGNGNMQGVDAGSVPGTENYGFNLRVSF